MMDTQRLVLLFIFGFSVLMLWDAWEKEHRPQPVAQAQQQAVPQVAATPKASTTAAQPASAAAGPVPGAATPATKGETITVRTDLIVAEIDTLGASLKKVELLKHKDADDLSKNLVLLGPEHHFEAQSGLVGEGPNHRTLWSAQAGEHALAPGLDTLDVRLTVHGQFGIELCM